jgi:hypothetical protein
MSRRAGWAALLAALAVVASANAPLAASTEQGQVNGSGGASVDPGGLDGWIETHTYTTPSGAVVHVRTRHRYRYVVEYVERMSRCADGVVERLVRIDVVTGERTVLSSRCPRPGSGRGPIEPPRDEEVLRHVPFGEQPVGVNPRVRGLTGMQTWLWYAGSTAPRSVALSLNGFAVTASVRPVAYRFIVTGPERATYRSSRPGSESHPAATHVFGRRGLATLAVEVDWRGSYTFVRPDGVAETVPLSVTTRAERPYRVVEAQPVVR